MHFPTWVDLKGEDAVPETVHHVVVTVDPTADKSWHNIRDPIETDKVHARDNIRVGSNTPGKYIHLCIFVQYEAISYVFHFCSHCFYFCRNSFGSGQSAQRRLLRKSNRRA